MPCTKMMFLTHCNFLFFNIYFWLCWVFVSVRGLSLVVASGGHSSSWCAGLSLSRPLVLRSTGSRRAGSVVVAHWPSCSVACGTSQTRARTRVPCIDRQILNHCATREAPSIISLTLFFKHLIVILVFINIYLKIFLVFWSIFYL